MSPLLAAGIMGQEVTNDPAQCETVTVVSPVDGAGNGQVDYDFSPCNSQEGRVSVQQGEITLTLPENLESEPTPSPEELASMTPEELAALANSLTDATVSVGATVGFQGYSQSYGPTALVVEGSMAMAGEDSAGTLGVELDVDQVLADAPTAPRGHTTPRRARPNASAAAPATRRRTRSAPSSTPPRCPASPASPAATIPPWGTPFSSAPPARPTSTRRATPRRA